MVKKSEQICLKPGRLVMPEGHSVAFNDHTVCSVH